MIKSFVIFLVVLITCSGCMKNIDINSSYASVDELEGNLYISGSSSMQEVCDCLADGFSKKYPMVDVVKSGTGSSEAPKLILDGVVQIGDMSRSMNEDEEPEKFDQYIIAMDGIAICVNKDKLIDNLSIENLKKIFTEQVTDWSELGAGEGTIILIGRDVASGTRSSFERNIGAQNLCKYMIELDSNGKVKEKVKSDPNAIGYISFSAIDSTVNVLSVDGVAACEDNILNGRYPLSRPFLQIVKKGSCDEFVKAWFNYVFSPDGEKNIRSQKLVPVHGKFKES